MDGGDLESVIGEVECLTFDISGRRRAQPFDCPLDGRVGRQTGGQARYGLDATDPAAARHGAGTSALTFAERQRPLTD